MAAGLAGAVAGPVAGAGADGALLADWATDETKMLPVILIVRGFATVLSVVELSLSIEIPVMR